MNWQEVLHCDGYLVPTVDGIFVAGNSDVYLIVVCCDALDVFRRRFEVDWLDVLLLEVRALLKFACLEFGGRITESLELPARAILLRLQLVDTGLLLLDRLLELPDALVLLLELCFKVFDSFDHLRKEGLIAHLAHLRYGQQTQPRTRRNSRLVQTLGRGHGR